MIFAFSNLKKRLPACVEEKTPKSCISCEKESIPHDRRGTKRSESPETSESLLVHCEFGSTSVTDPFNYKPEIGNLSTFDLPDELPDLPGEPFLNYLLLFVNLIVARKTKNVITYKIV